MLFSKKMTQTFCFWVFETLHGPMALRISLSLRVSIGKAFTKRFQGAGIRGSGPLWMFCPRWDAGLGWSQPRQQEAKRRSAKFNAFATPLSNDGPKLA